MIKIPTPDAPRCVQLSRMETITRQVGELQANERSAAELLLCPLHSCDFGL